jgi:hypothetical protein
MLPAYPGALALTLAVELPVYLAVLVGARLASWARALVAGVGVNLVTHPALWWGLRPAVARPAYPWIVVLAEVAVCAAEWALLVWWLPAPPPGRRRADRTLLAAASVAANAASTLVGLLVGGG